VFKKIIIASFILHHQKFGKLIYKNNSFTKLIFAAIIIRDATGLTITSIRVSGLADEGNVPNKNMSTSASKSSSKHPDQEKCDNLPGVVDSIKGCIYQSLLATVRV